MPTNILGISAYYHDSAACLVVDGRVVAAAQEERFTRKKNDHRFPSRALDYVVKASIVATSQGQGGKERDDLAGLTVPVKLSGSFDDLKYQVDVRAMAGQAAKSQVGAKVKEQIEQNRGKLEERIGDKLKGLLGR